MIHNEIIADAFDNGINDDNINDVSNAVRETLSNLDNGNIRVAEKSNGDWHVNESAKKAILLSFKLNQNKCIETNYTKFYDKVDSKFSHTSEEYLKEKYTYSSSSNCSIRLFHRQKCCINAIICKYWRLCRPGDNG